MTGFDDLDELPKIGNAEEIKKNAHVVNGGEATFSCPSCGGSGSWRGRGRCFKCNGAGKVSKGVVAAAKGKVTKANNFRAWCDEHRVVLDGMRRHRWNSFLAKLLDQVETDQRTLSDRQLECARDNIEKADAKDVAREAERRATKEATAQDVGVSAINKLFETALGNGLKRPMFRTERLVVKLAKLHADTLYVTDTALDGLYVGKIVDGKFYPRREAQADTHELLVNLASDPLKAAIAYGRSTGKCGCCGRELTDPVSVANGIGPICESNWGL